MKLKEATKKAEDGVKRLNCEIRRYTRIVGIFPDDNSELMLVCVFLRHITGTYWGNEKCKNMKHLASSPETIPIFV